MPLIQPIQLQRVELGLVLQLILVFLLAAAVNLPPVLLHLFLFNRAANRRNLLLAVCARLFQRIQIGKILLSGLDMRPRTLENGGNVGFARI